MGISEGTCPSGHQVDKGAQFCPTCGSPIAPTALTCSSGHELAPDQAFCSVCGGPAVTAPPKSADHSKSKRTPLIVMGSIAIVVVIGVGLLMFRILNASPQVTAGNAVELLSKGGIECDDVSSVAAGKGTTEAELIPATIVSCSVNGSDGNVDRDQSVALIIADSNDQLAKVMNLSGLCTSEENLSDVIASGPNWMGGGQGSSPSPVVAQKVAIALGGEVTTAGELTAKICESR